MPVPMGSGAERPSKDRTPVWNRFTPAGQRLVVERESNAWIVSCDESAARHHLLDVAVIEAIHGEVEAHWLNIDRERFARLVANTILSVAKPRNGQ